MKPPIFALPEHQVITALLPDIEGKQLDRDEAAARVRGNPRMTPIGINPHSERIYFADLGDYSCREWQHIYSIEHLAKAGLLQNSFSTSIHVLDAPHLLPSPPSPRGLILHVSRCGSTLMGKALARADGIRVVNQPSVLQHGFWAWAAKNWRYEDDWNPAGDPLNAVRFRNIIHLLCRPTGRGEEAVFIKFISWNSLYVDFIQQAFPDTPMLFMYRDPVEVIASVLGETTAVLVARGHRQAEFLSGRSGEALSSMDTVSYLAACYARYFDAILRADRLLKLLDYAEFKSARLPQILDQAFGLKPTQAQLAQMSEQFAVYSKDDDNAASFKDDSQRKRRALDDEQLQSVHRHAAESWNRLIRSPWNIFPSENNPAAISLAAARRTTE